MMDDTSSMTGGLTTTDSIGYRNPGGYAFGKMKRGLPRPSGKKKKKGKKHAQHK